jgi:WD40 repeat protein
MKYLMLLALLNTTISLIYSNSNTVTSIAVINNELLASTHDYVDETNENFYIIRIWNTTDGTVVKTLAWQSDPIQSLAVLSNMCLVSQGGFIKIWNISLANYPIKTLTIQTAGFTSLKSLKYDNDNDDLMACGSVDNTVKIISITNDSIIRNLTAHSDSVLSLAVLSKNKLASSSADTTIKIWNFHNGDLIQTLKGHTDWIVALTFHGNLLFSGSFDKTIKVWNLINYLNIQTLNGHFDYVTSLAMLKDNILASGGRDSLIMFWNITNSSLMHTLNRTGVPPSCLANLKGNLVSGSYFIGFIDIWNALSSKIIRTLYVPTFD